METPIQTLIIPNYVTKIKISNKRRENPYIKKHGSWKPKDLPNKHKSKLEEGTYSISKKGYLLDENGNKVLSNPKAAGTPRYQHISGNKFFSGFSSHHIRRKITKELKNFYRPFVKNMDKITLFPLRIEWDFYTVLGQADWDMDNMSFYWKYLQDTLVEESIIPEDNIKYITFPPSGKLYPVEDWEDRKFIIRFYHDDRSEITKLWKKLWS